MRNIVEILLFNLAGYLAGRYRDTTERDYIAVNNKAYPLERTGDGVLFCVDDTPNSILTAEWFSKSKMRAPETFVTLLWICHVKTGDSLKSFRRTANYKKRAKNRGIENLERIKGILSKEGVDEGRILLKTVDCDKDSPVSDQILEELKSGQYTTVLVSKHEATRTQEFFFGDTTIDLIRKSPIPVLVAKGPAHSENFSDGE